MNPVMERNAVEMFLQNLEEFVIDEEKIVTYKWLSKILNIHVNQSKQLLYSFHAQKKGLVFATYLVAGKLWSTGESHIAVVGQDKVADTKKLFKSLTSEHVYSVQKVMQMPSFSTLFSVDTQSVEESQECTESLGAIECKACVRQAAEELALLRVTIPDSTSASVNKTEVLAVPVSKEKESAKAESLKQREPTTNTSNAKNGIAAMFSAQTSKAAAKSTVSASNTVKSKEHVNKARISNFFSKVSKEEAEAMKAPNHDADLPIQNKENCKTEKVVDDVCPKSPSNKVIKEEIKIDPQNKSKSKVTKSSKTKRNGSKQTRDDPKKRKRIVQPSESSDEEMSEEENKPSSRESSPEPVLRAQALESDDEGISPSPVKDSNTGRVRRKRKVMKDKTFLDDDGYIVTEKVAEYESYSESDTESNESKKLKEAPSASQKSSSVKPQRGGTALLNKSPVKNKQQSLMSFFKKKD